MKKILKVILFVILFIILLIIVNFAYKFIWYQKILKASQKLQEYGNYTNIIQTCGWSRNNETGKYEQHYSPIGIQVKDGKFVDLNFSRNDDNKIIGKSYYTDDACISVDFENKTFSITAPNYSSELHILRTLINYPIYNFYTEYLTYDTIPLRHKVSYIFSSLRYWFNMQIKFENENGKDYIVFDFGNSQMYFDRETLLAEKEVMAGDGLFNGPYVNTYYTYDIGTVTDEDVNVPDLSEYSQIVYE